MPTPTVTEVEEFKVDIDASEEFVNSSELTFDTRLGGTKRTINGILFDSAVGNITTFSAATQYTLITEWVDNGGVIYRPKPSALPIGPATFDPNDWVIVQDWISRYTATDYSDLRTKMAALTYKSLDRVSPTKAGIVGAGTIRQYTGGTAPKNNNSTIIGATTTTLGADLALNEYYWERDESDTFFASWSGVNADGTDETLEMISALFAGAGKKIVFPAGVSLWDGSFIRIYPDTTLIRYGHTIRLKAGSYSTNIYCIGTRDSATYDAGYPRSSGIKIFGGTIDGNISNVTTTSSCTGLNFYQADDCEVRSLKIFDLPGIIGSGYGISALFSDDITISTCNINRTDRQNILGFETKNLKIDKCTLKDSYFRDCISVGTGLPIQYQSSTDAIISNTKMTNETTNGTHVVRFTGIVSAVMTNCRINGSKVGVNEIDGVYVSTGDDTEVLLDNLIIKKCSYGIQVETNATNKIVRTDNIMIDDCVNGVRSNADIEELSLSNMRIKADSQVLYVSGAKTTKLDELQLIGGTETNSVFNNRGAECSTTISNVTAVNNTGATAGLYCFSDNVVRLLNTHTVNCTNDFVRCATDAVVSACGKVTVNGSSLSGVNIGIGSTANRPVLSAGYNIGEMYLDTTLAANGKPIVWNGFNWVDSTGAIV